MSKLALVVAVVVAAALAVAAVFLTRSPAPGAGGPTGGGSASPEVNASATLDIDYSTVRAIQLMTDAGAQTVARTGAGAWLYVDGPDVPANLESVGWTVLPDRPRDAIAALKRVEPAPAGDAGNPGDDAATVRLLMESGATHTLRIARTPLGGRTLARIDDERSVLMDATVAASLTSPGPASWRLPYAMAGARDAARITIERRSGGDPVTIQLRRVDGRWGLTQPASARAQSAVVEGLQGLLGDIRIESFIAAGAAGAPSRAVTGLDDPSMIVRVETDVRTTVPGTSAARIETRTRELHIGRPANVDGTLLYATPDPAGTLLFTIPADRIRSIRTSPRSYLAVTATDVPAADVGAIELIHPTRRDVYRRSRGEWYEIRDGVELPIDAARIDELLAFLAHQPGEADLTESAGITGVAELRINDLSGATLDTMTWGADADGVIAIESGPITLRYTSVNVPALLPAAGRHSATPGPGPAITEGEYNK